MVVLLYRRRESRGPRRFNPGVWERERSRLEVGKLRSLADGLPNAPMRCASRGVLDFISGFQAALCPLLEAVLLIKPI